MAIDKTCFSWIQLVKKSDLPANAKYLCFYLSTFMNLEHDVAWPSQKRISYETGMSEPTVRKWLKWLNSEQWLIIHPSARPVMTTGGLQMQNEYLINIPEKVGKQLTEGKLIGSRGVNESSKGGKQFTPNNNRSNNTNNNGQNKFDLFWSVYPKKVKKKDALKKWKTLKLDTFAEQITQDVETRKKKDERWLRGFVPDPTTYLNGERWNDEIETSKQTVKLPTRGDCNAWVAFATSHGVKTKIGETQQQFEARVKQHIGVY